MYNNQNKMNAYKDQLQKNIKAFYVNSVLNGLDSILAPVVIIYQLQLIGLSLTEVFIGEAIFAASVLLAEIPSGIFADRQGRKNCLLMANFFIICSFATLTVAQNFWQIIAGQILCGIGMAFASGAKDALLFDTLKELKKEKKFKYFLSKLNTITFTMAIFANIAAGFIAQYSNLRIPLLLATFFEALSFFNILRFTETKSLKENQESSASIHFWKSIKFVWKKSMIRYIIIFSVILGIGMKLSWQLVHPYWQEMGVPIAIFGIAIAFHNAIAALVSHFAHRITQKYNDIFLLLLVLILFSSTFLIMYQFKLGIVFAILVPSLFQIIRALAPIVINDLIHQATFSSKRATVMSIKSFLQQGGQMIALPIFGYIADIWSLFTTFLCIAIFVFLFGGIFLWALFLSPKIKLK